MLYSRIERRWSRRLGHSVTPKRGRCTAPPHQQARRLTQHAGRACFTAPAPRHADSHTATSRDGVGSIASSHFSNTAECWRKALQMRQHDGTLATATPSMRHDDAITTPRARRAADATYAKKMPRGDKRGAELT